MTSLMLVLILSASAAAAPVRRDVNIIAADGTDLKATYFAAARPGPAVLLMHMCITTRTSWEPVARRLSAAGISALTVDYRGFGESGGPRFEPGTPELQRQLSDQWPGDLDAAFAWLVAQPGVDKSRIGAGGASCGVNNAVKLASRHPEVRSLVLLAGGTDSAGVKYSGSNPWLPIFSAAAADDEYDSQALQLMALVRGTLRQCAQPVPRLQGWPPRHRDLQSSPRHELALRALIIGRRKCAAHLALSAPSSWPQLIQSFLDGIKQLPISALPFVQMTLSELEVHIWAHLDVPIVEWTARRVGRSDTAPLSLAHVCDQFADDARAVLGQQVLARTETERCRTWIKKHLSERLTLHRMSAALNCSPDDLTRQVYESHRCSVHALVVRLRLEAAFLRIQAGWKIEATMVAVGYRNRTSFFRDFRRHFGLRPGDLKKVSQGALAD